MKRRQTVIMSFWSLFVTLGLILSWSGVNALATDSRTTGEKAREGAIEADRGIRDAGSDVKRGAKKTVRKMKRGVRKATGQNTVVDDVKDHVDDAKDDAQAKKEKMNH